MSEIEKAKKKLFGKNGLGCKNIKVSPGIKRNITAEEMAREINKALLDIEQKSKI